MAKDQNVRLQSGWFSERDASYLASGKPVIAQSTGLPICWFSSRRREMAEEARVARVASGGDWAIRNIDRAYLQEFREPPEVIGVTGVER